MAGMDDRNQILHKLEPTKMLPYFIFKSYKENSFYVVFLKILNTEKMQNSANSWSEID